jgi:hypothetical protein
VVAGMEGGHADAHLLDHANALMAKDAPRRTGGHVALQDVQIGPADRGLGELHDRVVGRLELGLRPVLDLLATP